MLNSIPCSFRLLPFQVLTDLHLEINQQYSSFEIPVCAKYLILVGDIGRLSLLHQRRYTIPGSRITILGCTLWSHVSPDSQVIVQSKTKDFQKVNDWTIDDHNAHIRTADAPETPTQKQQQPGLVVVTHHAPSRRKTSSPQHAQNAWSSAFGTDILSNGLLDRVRTWVFGDTHYTTDFREGGVRVVSNQRGYVLPWSKMDGKDGFDVGKVIRV
ncbi:hypothetical protein BDV27DRAFT_171826 [Aspergillus caelatus]|uniref:Calcineurin-like phosphoesterase domain-containing protein n=1 Tax=Aspergillus caelatus TaxID=61420 RepID=A0A5N7A7H8_9EURO|nr:uncharacterized protein BDV27DRAFT_171826 [Aspergillus caelatus]KAE8365176.1 hypothetical protein BDV27DRAFT_171826 [Aspergillus caelatus]